MLELYGSNRQLTKQLDFDTLGSLFSRKIIKS